MTIEFLPLQHAEIEGRGQVTLSLRAVGVGSGLGAAGSAVLRLGSSGQGQAYFGGGVDPVVPANGAAALNLVTSGQGYGRDIGGGAAAISVRAAGFQTAPGRGAGGARLALYGSGRQVTTPLAYAGLSARPRMISAFGGRWFASPRSSLAIGETRSSLPTHVLNEVLSIDENVNARRARRSCAMSCAMTPCACDGRTLSARTCWHCSPWSRLFCGSVCRVIWSDSERPPDPIRYRGKKLVCRKS
ncbi:hypothetical protein I5T99_16105 [Stenotrophomonas maltophilia]|nr:hypothetical protein [Stenotrophomonas maltophilia]